MPEFELVNLTVVVFDTDYYAMQSINGYLAWDRRTRVTFMTNEQEAFLEYLRDIPTAEHPDIIVMDADHMGEGGDEASSLREFLEMLHWLTPKSELICMAQSARIEIAEVVAANQQAKAYLLKQDVRMQIAWAIVYALKYDFVITQNCTHLRAETSNSRLYNAAILPEQRDYPEMTHRVRQAIRLCVIEGMPAHLAADEMGISLHTIRGYVKEGYRILESYDSSIYPDEMTPQELAFVRFTALEEPTDESA